MLYAYFSEGRLQRDLQYLGGKRREGTLLGGKSERRASDGKIMGKKGMKRTKREKA